MERKNKLRIVFFAIVLLFFSSSAWAQYDATILSLDFPKEMNPGSSYQLDLTFKNTGDKELNRSNCALKVSYLSGPSSDAGKSITMEKELTAAVLKEGQYTFRWTVWGPLVPGSYKMNVALVKGTTTLAKQEVTVKVEESYTATINFKFPNPIIPEGEYGPLEATIRNAGKATWPSGKYELVAKVTSSPSDASKDDKEAFEFEEEIDLSNLTAGNEKYHKFGDKFEAPSGGGTYNVDVTLNWNGKPFNAQNNVIRVSPSVKNEEQKAEIKENVTTKMYPEKKYSVSFDIQNGGILKWDQGSYSLKATVVKKPSGLDSKIFEGTENFNGNEMKAGGHAIVAFPEITPSTTPGIVEVKYEILMNGKETEIDGAEKIIRYEIVEVLPELNIGRITLEDAMVSGKTYTVKLDIKNYDEVAASKNDWEVKCKTRTLKPSNYKPPRGVFDISMEGIDMKAGESKYISGSIKAPKVDQETSIRLEFEVYYKGDRMGGPKTFDIKIKS
ncbi:MAG: hypothetical protein R2781_09035 [Flavobacteriaceae bacterium]